ncbi:MAG: CoA transferase [Thermoanaerobaculia bacterium]|nr:CoA transferase [Thermoanaerobaculia bacterium]
MNDSSQPLHGVLVVDLSRHLPGPLVTRLLADLGARVVKVEEPRHGDPTRQAPPFTDETSSLSALLIHGHESLALDLKKDDGRRALEDLLLHADVFVESFRPGTLARLGLEPDRLMEMFPRLILCSVSGFGQDGELAWRAGHDLTYQAMAGTLAAGGGMPAVQVADYAGAWSAVAAVTAALFRREAEGEGGRGCRIDQSLLDAAGHAAITSWASEADGAKGVGQPLLLTGAYPCYDLYRTKDDGTLAVAFLEPKFWRSFCEAAGHKGLIPRQFSKDPKARREVEGIFRARTRDEWADFAIRHDLPAEPVLSLEESEQHGQVRTRALTKRGDDGLRRLGYPAMIDGHRPRGADRIPGLGEDTDALIEEFGLAADVPVGKRKRKGIGRRRSVKAWASKVATRVMAKLSSPDGD